MIEHEWISGDGNVPAISDEELAARMSIFPVIDQNGSLWAIAPVDPRRTAYTWDPKFTKEVSELEPFAEITVDHTCGFYGFFKPSIAEVLSQIPETDLPKTVAFRIMTEKGISIYRSGTHQRSTVQLYGARPSPDGAPR